MNNQIRVLCVFASLNPGGAETMCMNLYRNINKDLIQFDFIKHTTEKCKYEDEILSLGGRIFVAPKYKISNYSKYIKWWKKHFEEHPEHQIVHGHYYTIASIFLKVAKKYNRITIAHAHSTNISGNFISRFFKKYHISKITKNADHCFACSTNAGEWMFKGKQFYVLQNAVDLNKYAFKPEVREKLRAELNISENFVIGTVGRIENVKNPFGIIEIFNKIKEKNDKAKFIWIGDGSYRDMVKAKIQEYNLEDSFILTGIKSDVYNYLQAMDYFILPSFYEGLPVSLIEAQAAGLKCAVSEIVSKESNITGRIDFIPIDNLELWSEKICENYPYSRDIDISIIKNAGYDINTSSESLANFYISLINK